MLIVSDLWCCFDFLLKNTIEESFKILSDFVEIEPFYVYKIEYTKAHFTICVLSYLIFRVYLKVCSVWFVDQKEACVVLDTNKLMY